MEGHRRDWGTTAGEDAARAAVEQVAGAWFQGCREHLGWSYAAWACTASTDLVAALLSGTDIDDAAVRLGATRARGGASWDDTLCEIAVLLDVAAADVDDALLVAALAVGFDAGAVGSPGEGRVGQIDDLSSALQTLYRQPASTPRTSHALIVLDVDLRECAAQAHGHAVHIAARRLQDLLPGAEATVGIGRSRFAVLVRRHPGLALTLRSLVKDLTANPQLAGAEATVWLRSLPELRSGLPALIRTLIAPAGSWAGGHVVADDPLVDRELQAVLSSDRGARSGIEEREFGRRRGGRMRWGTSAPSAAAGFAAAFLALGLSVVVPEGHRHHVLTSPAPAAPGDSSMHEGVLVGPGSFLGGVTPPTVEVTRAASRRPALAVEESDAAMEHGRGDATEAPGSAAPSEAPGASAPGVDQPETGGEPTPGEVRRRRASDDTPAAQRRRSNDEGGRQGKDEREARPNRDNGGDKVGAASRSGRGHSAR